MLDVDTGLDLVEGEGGCAGSGPSVVGGDQCDRADSGSNGRNSQRASEKAAARETRGDDFAHRAIVGWVVARAVVVLEQTGAEYCVWGKMVVHGRDLWLTDGWRWDRNDRYF